MRPFLAPIFLNPVARTLLALLLLALSLSGLAATAYGDQLVNGGVSYSAPAQPVPYTDLNPVGVNTFLEKEVDPQNVTRSLDMIQAGGFKWIRQTFAWNDIEIAAKGDFTDRRDPNNVHSAWDKYDFIVNEATKRGINIIARLDSIPVWARIPGSDLETFPKGPPNNNQDYADFVAAVAQRYKGKIKFYQLWNEPNLYGEWGGFAVDPAAYTALLKAGYLAIKGVDPQAVVISAALAPTTPNGMKAMNDVLFLEGMYQAGAKNYFDIMSTMLYGLGQSPDDRRLDLNRLSFERPVLLHEVMARNGDADKPIWISEYAWISLPANWDANCRQQKAANPDDPSKQCGENIWGRSVDPQTQAQWEVAGIERARSEWPWLGVMNVWYFREPQPNPLEPATYFAIVDPDYTAHSAYYALQAYSVSLTGAGRPVAQKPLWNIVGFPFLYAIFGLFALASAGYGANSITRWAGAALNRPEGRYRETVREFARNGALVVGMALLLGLYYKSSSLPVILLSLAGWWVLALVKPSTALAGVAATIPFFWQPKVIGSERFPLAETLLWLTFGAVIVRYGIRRYLPAFASRLRIYESFSGQTEAELERRLDGERNGYAPKRGLPPLPWPPFLQPRSNGRHNGVPGNTRLFRWGAHAGDIEPAGWSARPRPVRYRYYAEPLPRASYSLATSRYEASAPVAVAAPPTNPHITEPMEEEPELATAPAELTPDQLPTMRVSRRSLQTGPIHRRQAARVSPNPVQAQPQTQPASLVSRLPSPLSSSVQRLSSSISSSPAWQRFLAWNADDTFAPPAVAMLLLGLFSLLTMADKSFAPDTARALRWTIIEPVLFYFLLTDVIKNRRSLLRLVDFFVLGGVVVALVGLVQFAQGGSTLDVEGVSRIISVYQHPDNLALYLGRVVAFAGCLALFLPWGWRKLIYGGVTLPLLACFILTYSRAGWVAVVVAVLVAAFVAWRWRQGRVSRPLTRRTATLLSGGAAVLLGLAIIVGVIVYPYLPDRIKTTGSGFLRVAIWKTAGHMLLDHPVFGIGPDQFLNQFQSSKYSNLYIGYVPNKDQREPDTAHPHNVILDWWLTLGIMGVFVLLWLLWKYLREAINRVKIFAHGAGADATGRAIALGLLALVIDFSVHGLVDNSYFLMDLALTFWLACGLIQVLRKT